MLVEVITGGVVVVATLGLCVCLFRPVGSLLKSVYLGLCRLVTRGSAAGHRRSQGVPAAASHHSLVNPFSGDLEAEEEGKTDDKEI